MNNEPCCPRCGIKSTRQNRIITDNCGHNKCRSCFLEDDEECLECCKQAQQQQQQITIRTTNAVTKVKENNKIKSLNGGNKRRRILTSQIRFTHIEQVTTEDGAFRYLCTICRKSFGSASQRYYHAVCGNEAAKKYTCGQCEKSFVSRSHFNYHLESHISQTFACPQCSKQFSKKTALKRHQKLHGVLTKSECTECGKTFSRKESLKAHLEQHRNIFRFVCEICPKKYALKSALHQHKLKHFARKHQCSECGKQFLRNGSLKLHMKTHTMTENFTCKKCFKQFRYAGALLRHAKLHEDTIKYKCIQCDITSKRKDNILRHVRNIHLVENFQKCFEIIKPNEQETSTQANISAEIINASSFIADNSACGSSISEDHCNLPKTVEYASVIKCIGNVEPVKIPDEQKPTSAVIIHDEVEHVNTDTQTYTITILENVSNNITSHQEEGQRPAAATVTKKRLKKRYDPIEMYRKILISDDEADRNQSEQEEEMEEESTMTEKLTIQQQQQQLNQQRATTHSASNFSEMHWRKNFKYTYEYQEY